MVSLVQSKSIAKCSLHSPLPLFRRLYAWPFFILYTAWLYIYVIRESSPVFQHEELYILLLGIIALANGVTFLCCYWSVTANAFLSCKLESNVDSARFIRIIPCKHRGSGQLAELFKQNSGKDEIWFFFQKRKYVYNRDKKMFIKVKVEMQVTFGELNDSKGLNGIEVIENQLKLYGANVFDIPLPSFGELFREHAVAPFFVFQIFCVGLWCLDEFWYYSVFTLLMLLVFESTVVQQRIRNLKEFRTMSIKPIELYVCRIGKWSKIMSDALLPGDLCSLSHTNGDNVIPCDLIILGGTCVVNEAMLSGESTPLLKESIKSRQSQEILSFSDVDKSHILFGGTKILQTTEDSSSLKAPDNGCIARVLRTGFYTQQGKLVRTMIFSTERMTANSLESLMFILFLLIFAVAAAIYVWIHGVEDPDRNKYKLLLECVLIITAVVPPELPMELSLAVNTALMALSRYAIYCTEPFRIPFAGKVDICCFDKTGTLTDEKLVVEGVAGLDGKDPLVAKKNDLPNAVCEIVASCHSLLCLEDSVVGDPMELAALEFVNWKLESNTVVKSLKVKGNHCVILKKHAFSSSLKRMSAVCTVKSDSSEKTIATVKGAPETIQSMLKSVPEWYEKTYQHFAMRGSRVLALASKTMDKKLALKEVPREKIECDLDFAGFLVFHCPLKASSKNAIKMLKESSHRVVMITGDNPLTAIHVAKELDMVGPSVVNVCVSETNQNQLDFEFFHEKRTASIKVGEDLPIGLEKAEICATGNAIDIIAETYDWLIPEISVFSRASPRQKELILTRQKEKGFITLMCGDGTNDVGALKQAHIGVALLDGKPEDLEKILKQARIEMMKKRQEEMRKTREELAKKLGGNVPASDAKGMSFLDEMEDEAPLVKLGDASVAAPFTSKISTIDSVCNIIRQGRCTLVTTIQMYKILALNSLISAYSLSVLHLDGIRYGDFQVTITGMLLAGCFLFLTKSQPVKNLSKKRPHSNIFNAYIILSVLLQFAVHVCSLLFTVFHAKRLM